MQGAIKIFKNSTVLITGGTGSFGTAFSHYLAKNPPWKLIIFSRDWQKQMDLRNAMGNPSWARWFIGDIRDKDRLMRAFKGVDIVVHAAAIKDLESCEYNPSEAMLTNIVGTQNVIDACIEHGVSKSILISTDKACNAVNAYGKSKAMAEALWTSANRYSADDKISFSVCRYGNVVGSNGSVVPVWKKLIEQGVEELPITHPDMTRFWFPMGKAVEFVVDCIEKMRGDEIFFPRLPSIRITDLCKVFGKPYKVTGIRQGEKIHEEMMPGYDSGSNDWFLTVDEIRVTIGA